MAYRDWRCPDCEYVLCDVPDSSGPYFCPNHTIKLEKVISAPAVHFTGEGWTPTFFRTGAKEK